jgi:HEXXH motif-containing protein
MTGPADPLWPVSRAAFASLAAGGGGQDAVEQLAVAQRVKHARLLFRVIDEADAVGHPQRQWAAEGRNLLARALQHDLAAAKQVLRHPSVGLWARQTWQALRNGQPCPGPGPGGLCAIAAAAAIRAGLPAEISIPVSDGQAVLPSLGVAAVPGPTAVARCADGQATVGDVHLPADPHTDAPGWNGLRRVHAGAIDGLAFDVLVDDLDPFRFPEGERLTGHQPATSWAEILTEGWAVLRAYHPHIATEVAAAVSVVTPIAGAPLRAVSASSPEVFGTVAMSWPADAVSCAETLTHETHHIKLGALLDFVPLTEPDDGRRYYAPWRPDPRPLGALVQGAYAYLGVSRFWRRQRFQAGYQEDGDVQFARWRAAASLAVDTMLACGGLTSTGQEFVSGMKRTLQAWLGDRVGAAAAASAEHAAREHRAAWEAAHGPVRP